MSDFAALKQQVTQAFDAIKTKPLFQIELEHNEMFNAYLSAIPETERQEYNCNCCKNFLNRVGGMVAIKDGKYVTLWDNISNVPYPLDKVAPALSKLINKKKISNLLTSDTEKLGTDFNYQILASGDKIRREHFYLKSKGSTCHVFTKKSSTSIGTFLGSNKTDRDVYKRALDEITQDAVDTVLDLINQGSLYRGNEFKALVDNFSTQLRSYLKLKNNKEKDIFAWVNYHDGGRVRNSVIGTLLVDLSEGVELDRAVASFEAKVAPTNYKRPSALITQSMINTAEKRIQELGIEQSLYRRHATSDDISVEDVIYVNRNKLATDVFAQMKEEAAVSPKTFSKVDKVSIEDFITKVVPTATSIKLFVENKHSNNFMNLIAPVYADAPNILAWNNPISWSYVSGTTDAIKERVAKAGGAVNGVLRISLAWSNFDDLDLHVIEPSGYEIYFSNKQQLSPCGGMLDVDMNAGGGSTRKPVENVIYAHDNKLTEGDYKIIVHNYKQREFDNIGFTVDVESSLIKEQLHHDKIVRDGQRVLVATINYSKANGFTLKAGEASSTVASRPIFGIATNTFQEVDMIVNSPNHWSDEGRGNQHTFFILKKVHVDVPVRGLYNEFLRSDLTADRKVFEVLGKKLMIPDEGQAQLAGLGFSSTQRNSFFCKVEGNFSRILEVTI